MNNQKIAILVDSGCDVPHKVCEQYDIRVLPLRINFKDREYADGVDITNEEICAKLEQEIPKTSLPSADDIIAQLDKIKADGYERVLAFTISSGLSGTFGLLNIVLNDYTALESTVIDTKNISIGSGMVVIRAAQLIEQGMAFDEVVRELPGIISKTKVFFCLDTLEYLYKGGRIGLVSSLLGSALNLKPIISCNEDGIYYVVGKALGSKRCMEKLISIASDFAGKAKSCMLAIHSVSAGERGVELVNKVKDRIKNGLIVSQGSISAALIVHTGPGLLGVGVLRLD